MRGSTFILLLIGVMVVLGAIGLVKARRDMRRRDQEVWEKLDRLFREQQMK